MRQFLRKELSAPTVSAQSRFLYQFLDPGAGAYRGPSRSNLPTFTYQTTSFTDVTLEVAQPNVNWAKTGINFDPVVNPGTNLSDNYGAYNAYYDGTPSSTQFVGSYFMPTEGAPLTVVALPHKIWTEGGGYVKPGNSSNIGGIPAMSANQLCSGFIVPSSTPFGGPMYTQQCRVRDTDSSTSASEVGAPGYMYPLNPLTTHMAETTQSAVVGAHAGTNVLHHLQGVVTQFLPYRVTGMIMEIENISPPIFAKGIIIGGDNRSMYCTTEETSISWQANEQLSTEVQEKIFGPDITMSANGLPNPVESSFTGPTLSQNRRDLGHFEVGPRFRSSFVPSNDRVLEFKSDIANLSTLNVPHLIDTLHMDQYDFCCNTDPNTALGYYSTLGEMLANNPACYLTISGWQKGCSIRVKTTVNYEVLISNSSPLAMLMSSARFSSNYLVNWSTLQGVYATGKNADNLRLAAGNKVVMQGTAASVGAYATPSPVAPVGWNIGVQSLAPATVSTLPPRVQQALSPTLAGHASITEHGGSSVHHAGEVAEVGMGAGMAYVNRGGIMNALRSFGSRFANMGATARRTAQAAYQTIRAGAATYGPRAIQFAEAAAPYAEEAALIAL